MTSHTPAQFIVGRMFIYIAVGLVENVIIAHLFQTLQEGVLIINRWSPRTNQKSALLLFEGSALDPFNCSSHLALSLRVSQMNICLDTPVTVVG